ncbi:MAG TPA: hypothetical protein DD727_03645, partial [Clostridiales bacterium]|nr:hypothetical protein [Clostridiales bacterium]
MIDLQTELSAYRPLYPEQLTEKGYMLTEEISNALVLYNKALENLRNGNEDIAIIELKKALYFYPEFNEAVNLLGLCYAATNQLERAEAMFRHVITSETNSVLALGYLENMRTGDAAV